jgi:hypothetical protein
MSSGTHEPEASDHGARAADRSGAGKDGLAALAVVVLAVALIALVITQIV